jgi:hypothetical protein
VLAGAGIEGAPLPRARLPYKHNEPRRHKIPTAKYKVSNWREYVMIPTEVGHGFQFEAGQHSGLMSATPAA